MTNHTQVGWRVYGQFGLQGVDATHGISESIRHALLSAPSKYLIERTAAKTHVLARFAALHRTLTLSLSLHEKISEQKTKVALAQKSGRHRRRRRQQCNKVKETRRAQN